jgi:hypothetical protein
MRVRVVISQKHPEGAVWAEAPRGWVLVPVEQDIRSAFALHESIAQIDATMVLANQFASDLVGTLLDDVDQPASGMGCRNCG